MARDGRQHAAVDFLCVEADIPATMTITAGVHSSAERDARGCDACETGRDGGSTTRIVQPLIGPRR
jgi:hypothetical protein